MKDETKESGLAGGVKDKDANSKPAPQTPGAVHSADIEYQMGTLSTNPVFAWNETDYKVSKIFMTYFLNFIKTGNPNGNGLPKWDAINGQEFAPVMLIDANPRQEINKKKWKADTDLLTETSLNSTTFKPKYYEKRNNCGDNYDSIGRFSLFSIV